MLRLRLHFVSSPLFFASHRAPAVSGSEEPLTTILRDSILSGACSVGRGRKYFDVPNLSNNCERLLTSRAGGYPSARFVAPPDHPASSEMYETIKTGTETGTAITRNRESRKLLGLILNYAPALRRSSSALRHWLASRIISWHFGQPHLEKGASRLAVWPQLMQTNFFALRNMGRNSLPSTQYGQRTISCGIPSDLLPSRRVLESNPGPQP